MASPPDEVPHDVAEMAHYRCPTCSEQTEPHDCGNKKCNWRICKRCDSYGLPENEAKWVRSG